MAAGPGRGYASGITPGAPVLYTFLLVTSLTLTLEAAVFLALGNLALSPAVIAQIAATRIGYSSPVIKSLARQSANTSAGVLLLVIAFALQAWALLRGPTLDELGAADRCGAVVGLSVALVTGCVAWIVANTYAARLESRALAHSAAATAGS